MVDVAHLLQLQLVALLILHPFFLALPLARLYILTGCVPVGGWLDKIFALSLLLNLVPLG